MKATKMVMLVLGLFAGLFAGQVTAEYYNYSDFTITGTLAGTEGGAFPWASSDNAWEQGTGYAWGEGNKAIMKYDAETSSELSLSMPMANGVYILSVADIFISNLATSPVFAFTVEGQNIFVIATDAAAWTKTYEMGTVVVTDGQLDIVFGNPTSSGANAWLGFSGFEVEAVLGTTYYNYSDFTATGTLAGTVGGAFPWASTDDAWEQGGGTGGVWSVGTNAIMKYSYETASDLTLSMPISNGLYELSAIEIYTSGSAGGPVFPITVEGKDLSVTAASTAWIKNYLMGEVSVTDGQLDIVLGNPTLGASAWLGLSGFTLRSYSCSDVSVYFDEDLTGDCYVNLLDLEMVSSAWLNTTSPDFPEDAVTPDFYNPTNEIVRGTAVVDGDISEWASHVEWIPLDKVYDGITGDVTEAKMALRWSEDTDKIYAAVVVTDTDHDFLDSYSTWNASDRIEIYSQGDAAGGAYSAAICEIAQQYIVGPDTTGGFWESWAYDEALIGDPDPDFESAVSIDGDNLIYEVAVQSFDNYSGKSGASGSTVYTALSVGNSVGFDIVAGTMSTAGFGMLAANDDGGKSVNADQFQVYTLVENASCGSLGYVYEDIDRDCDVDFTDFSKLALMWLGCNNPGDSNCTTILADEYYNYSDFTITGTLAGTEGGAFPWASADNAWEQGTEYAWTGTDHKAIMKYDSETASDLTLSMPIANGTYQLSAVDVFTDNSAFNPVFSILVEGTDMSVTATDATAWLKTYVMGIVVVTDGQLDIVLGNAYSGTSAWLGLSGFKIEELPDAELYSYNYSDFTITGNLAGDEGDAFYWMPGDNAWEQGIGYPLAGIKSIMKFDSEVASDLTLSMPIANGTYFLSVVDIFTGNSDTSPVFPFTVEGQDMSIAATETNAWTKTYMMGMVVVTDGQLDIVVGNPTSDTGQWLSLSGFDVYKL